MAMLDVTLVSFGFFDVEVVQVRFDKPFFNGELSLYVEKKWKLAG